MFHRRIFPPQCSQLLRIACIAVTLLALSSARAMASTLDFGAPFSFGDFLGTDGVTSSLIAADLNGDGRTEIIESQATFNRIRIWAPDGSGGIAIVGTLSCPSPGQPVVADFDGDGRMDIAVASDSIVVFHGLGGGAFEPAQMHSAGIQSGALASGDINGDGRPDLVVCTPPYHTIVVLINTGGSFAPPMLYESAASIAGMAVGDVNGDGHADVAATGPNGLSLYFGMSDGTLEPPIAVPFPPSVRPLTFADLDGDGAVDLVVLDERYEQPIVFWNDGHGGLGNGQQALTIGKWDATTVADIDGDGRLDLVCASSDFHFSFAVAWNQGARSWDSSVIGMDTFFRSIVACDYDLDGFKDVVGGGPGSMVGFRHLSPRHFTGLQEYAVAQPINGIWAMKLPDGRPAVLLQQPDSMRVMVAEPDGRLDPAVAYLDAPGAYGIDWNGDGCLDLAIPRGDSLEIQLGGGGRRVVPALPAGTFLCNGDFNGDGLPDLLLDVSGMGKAIAYRDPLSGYTTPVPISTDSTPILDGGVLTAADFDGDGLFDLAAGYRSTSGAYDSIAVLLNVGSDQFRRGTTLTLVPPNGYPNLPVRGLFALDLDGDHRPDLTAIAYAANASGGIEWVYRGQGDGIFEPTAGPFSLVSENGNGMVMDLNGDGLTDLVAWTPENTEYLGSFSFRANLGVASFDQIGLKHYVGPHLISPAIGDLNGDGHLDVVLGLNDNRDGGRHVRVLLNTLPPDVVTPTLVSPLQAIMEGGRARIEWYSPGDLSLAGAVWRSENAGPWQELGSASSDGRGMIVFVDATVRPGSRYAYRLDYTAAGGARSTDPIELSVPASGLSLSLALAGPNPAHGRVAVLCSLPAASTATIDLLDISGRRVATRKIMAASTGPATFDLGPGSHLPSGIYWVRLTQGGRSVSAKTVLLP